MYIVWLAKNRALYYTYIFEWPKLMQHSTRTSNVKPGGWVGGAGRNVRRGCFNTYRPTASVIDNIKYQHLQWIISSQL